LYFTDQHCLRPLGRQYTGDHPPALVAQQTLPLASKQFSLRAYPKIKIMACESHALKPPFLEFWDMLFFGILGHPHYWGRRKACLPFILCLHFRPTMARHKRGETVEQNYDC
jgi:hypothetical protein